MKKHFKKSFKDLTPYQQQFMKDVRDVFKSKALLISQNMEKTTIKRSVDQ